MYVPMGGYEFDEEVFGAADPGVGQLDIVNIPREILEEFQLDVKDFLKL